jgi:hypothetical protein
MLLRTAFAMALGVCSVWAQESRISGENIRARVKYLASDELAGRGVGTNGEKLATSYIASQLQAAGLKPGGDNNTYFQKVPLVGSTTLPSASLKFSGKGSTVSLISSRTTWEQRSRRSRRMISRRKQFCGTWHLGARIRLG